MSKVSFDQPLMKFVTGVEYLLGECEKWERNSSREVSLSAESTQLAKIVARWRKLELCSWPTILPQREQEHSSKTAVWWFRMYPSIVSLVMSSDHVISLEEMREQLQTLDQFIMTASLGDFAARVGLVKSLSLQLEAWLVASRSEKEESAEETSKNRYAKLLCVGIKRIVSLYEDI